MFIEKEQAPEILSVSDFEVDKSSANYGDTSIPNQYPMTDDGIVLKALTTGEYSPYSNINLECFSSYPRSRAGSGRVLGSELTGNKGLYDRSYPVLTKKDEVYLSKIIQSGHVVRAIPEGKYDLSDKQDLIDQILSDAEQAGDQMIKSNMRLLVLLAGKYNTSARLSLDRDDLILEGYNGLARAVLKFDWSKGFAFSTYASPWIRQALNRGVAEKDRMIRLPVNKEAILGKIITKTRLHHPDRNLEDFSNQELAEIAGASEEDICTIMPYLLRSVVSLDSTMKDESGSTDMYNYVSSTTDEYDFTDQDQKKRVQEIMHTVLDAREIVIIENRFGFGSNEVKTLREVGEELGISRERTRQLETRALTKLQEHLANFSIVT